MNNFIFNLAYLSKFQLFLIFLIFPLLPVMVPFYKIQPFFICYGDQRFTPHSQEINKEAEISHYYCRKEQICANEYDSIDRVNSFKGFSFYFYSEEFNSSICEINNKITRLFLLLYLLGIMIGNWFFESFSIFREKFKMGITLALIVWLNFILIICYYFGYILSFLSHILFCSYGATYQILFRFSINFLAEENNLNFTQLKNLEKYLNILGNIMNIIFIFQYFIIKDLFIHYYIFIFSNSVLIILAILIYFIKKRREEEDEDYQHLSFNNTHLLVGKESSTLNAVRIHNSVIMKRKSEILGLSLRGPNGLLTKDKKEQKQHRKLKYYLNLLLIFLLSVSYHKLNFFIDIYFYKSFSLEFGFLFINSFFIYIAELLVLLFFDYINMLTPILVIGFLPVILGTLCILIYVSLLLENNILRLFLLFIFKLMIMFFLQLNTNSRQKDKKKISTENDEKYFTLILRLGGMTSEILVTYLNQHFLILSFAFFSYIFLIFRVSSHHN
jgi:hypothetical protein